MPRSTDSGNDASAATSTPVMARAQVTRTVDVSAGGTFVIVGASQIRMAPVTVQSGRKQSQTTRALPTQRRFAASSFCDC